MTIFNLFKGKLSYALAVLAIAGAGAGYLLHIIDAQTALGMAWGGLALFGIRRSLSTPSI